MANVYPTRRLATCTQVRRAANPPDCPIVQRGSLESIRIGAKTQRAPAFSRKDVLYRLFVTLRIRAANQPLPPSGLAQRKRHSSLPRP
jgi:hypothetical protein